MAQYDGSIRINTDITTKSAQVQLAALENRMLKTADKVVALRDKMEALKNTKIPTQEYKDISAQIEKAEQKFNKLLEKQEQMQREGKDNGVAWQRLNDQIDEVGNEIRYAQGELQDLVDTGKAFTLGSSTEEYSRLGQQLQYAENELEVLYDKHEILIAKQKEGYQKLSNVAKKSFDSIYNALKKVNSIINSFGAKIKNIAQNHLPLFRKESERAKSSLSGFSSRLKSLALSLLIFNQLRKIFSSSASAIREGFTNLYNENERFKTSIDSLKASLSTLKNALSGAFAPIVEIAIPYIQKLVEWLTEAVNLIGQLVAALTGRKTYTRAIKQSAKASEDAAGAIEDETDAIDRQLSPLDKLNNMTSQNNKDKAGSSSGAGSVGGTMFEEVPIEGSILDIAEKIKDILSKLFAPLKEAWDREGQFVMDSWKYALDEVWKLIKDIGRDFLTVWQEEATVDILANILHIIGDIGLTVGHLARNFREAWNENEVGLNILRNIRDIIGIIVQHIRNMADATVEWADKLDFYPILDAFNRFLDSIKPVVDAIWGILEDFYTHVLLPLGKWTIEKGLPELLQVFIDFNNKVDWASLRQSLAEFWDHLEPFAETVGEGLIIFIDRVADALANFLNSQEFKDFLVTVEEWMDSVTPEDVADALESIAKGLIALKLALLGFSAIKGIAGILTTIKAFLAFFGVGGGAAGAGAGMAGAAGGAAGLSIALMNLLAAFEVVAAAVAGWEIGSWIAEKLGYDPQPFKDTMQGIKDSFTDGSWKEALDLWGQDIHEAFLTLGERQAETWESIKESIGQKFEEIRTNIANKLNDIKIKWFETWGSFKEKVTSAFGSIKTTVGSILDWIKSKIESIKSAINGLSGHAKSVLGGGLGGSLGGAFKGISYSGIQVPVSPVVAALSNVEIPAYATGQVIPRTMKQHLAILGDNSQETEIVSPLSTMKQALVEALVEAGVVGGNNQDGDIVINIDGREVFRVTQKHAREYKKRTRKPAFG